MPPASDLVKKSSESQNHELPNILDICSMVNNQLPNTNLSTTTKQSLSTSK